MNKLGIQLAKAWSQKSLINLNQFDKKDIPYSREDAYKAQNIFYRTLNKKTIGWKIGAVSEQVQKEEGFDGPVPGKIFKESLITSGSKLKFSNIPSSNLECEFAIQFTKKVDIRENLEKEIDIFKIFTALDITSSRYVQKSKYNYDKLTQMYLGIADHGNGGLILIGSEIKDWRNIDLNNIKIKLNINGKISLPYFRKEKRMHPIDSLKSFINEFKDKNIQFNQNDWLLCGSLTEPYNIRKNDYIKIDYEDYSKLEINIK